MNEDPCQKEREEFKEAMQEWVNATNASKEFVVDKPLDPIKDIAPKPVEYLERMKEVYDRENKAREKFIEMNNKLLDCEAKHRRTEE